MKRASVYLVLGLAACVGCSEPAASVQGTVTIDGQLARRGTVQFHPVEEGPTAYGSIAEDGSYAIRVGQGDLSDPNSGDVPLGEYIVTVVVNMPSRRDELVGESGPPTPGARLSAEKYADKDTSELRHTVKAGQNVIPLELEGASADKPAPDDEETQAPPETEPAEEAVEPAVEDAPAQTPANGETTPAVEGAAAPVGEAPSEPEQPGDSTEEQTQ